MITDTSENGTQLNGKWLPKGQPHRLKEGDAITIEGRELTIRFK
jgi:predicted component of type VI protein secretion system